MISIYLLIGALSGLLAGLLGIGGGIIIVPALAAVFDHYQIFPDSYVMHMAIGTSLASLIVTLLASLRQHMRRRSVRWDLVRRMLPALMVGVVIGAIVAHDLPAKYLRIIFSMFLFYIAYGLLFKNPESQKVVMPSRFVIRAVACIIGALSSVLGAGGGAMLIPFLLKCQVNIREATGTAVACGVGVGLVATVCFMLLGTSVLHMPESTGYIYWPAFIGISITSIMTAPVGTSIAYRLPTSVLRHVFGIFLLLVAIYLIVK